MAIVFDCVGNDDGVVKMFENIQASIKRTANVVEQLSNVHPMDGLEKQIEGLQEALRNNDKAIEATKLRLKTFAEEAKAALEAGDISTFNAKQTDFSNELESLKDLITETNNYKQALEELTNAKGLAEQTRSPMFFATKEEYDNVTEIRGRIAALQEQLGNFNGTDEELYKLHEALSDEKDKLREAEEAAAGAAAALGPGLGERAAETSTKLYNINDAVEKQTNVVNELRNKYNDAANAVNALEGSTDTAAREKALSDYERIAQQLRNAENELTNLNSAQQEAQREWNRTSQEIDRHNSIITKLCGGEEKLNEIMDHLPDPLKQAVNGLEGMTGAAKAFIATPLGAVLAVLILAWKALSTWFESSKEGQLAFAEASGYVSGVLNQLKEIVIAVGKALYTAFTEPEKAGKAFVEFLKDQIVNRLKAVGLIGQSVGDILYNAFTFNWEGIEQGAKDLANAVGQFGTGIEKPITKAKNAIEGLHKAASENAKIGVETKELDIAISEWKKRNAELDKMKAEAQEKMYNTSLSYSEREKALKEYKEAIKEQTDTETKFANKRKELQERSMALTTNKIEDYEKLNDLEAKGIQVQARGQRQLASLQRRANSIEGGREKAAAARAKEKAEAWKHSEDMVKLERDAARARKDASIAAIQNQAERERAEREEQYKRTTEDIKEQENGIYKTIYEQRKRAYENANKGNQNATPYELTPEGAAGYQTEKARAAMKQSFSTDEMKQYTLQTDALEDKIREATENRKRQLMDEREAQIQAMRDYIKEYGSIQEQKAAIAAEYDKKIEDERDAARKAMLEKQKEDMLAELSMKELQGTIDWETVFNDLGRQSASALRDLKEKLRSALDAKDITIENAKILSEKIREVEDAIRQKSDPWAAWLPGLRERKRLTEQVAEAERNANAAMDEYVEKQGLLMRSQLNAQSKIRSATGMTVDIGDLTIENKDKLLATVDQTTEAGRLAADAINGMAIASVDAGKSLEGLTQAQKDYKSRQEALNKFTKGGSISQYFKDITAGFGLQDYVGLVNGNVQSMADLVDNIGLAGTEFGEGVHEFAEGTQGFANALQSLASGDIFGAANGIIDGLQGYGHLAERIFGFSFSGSNAEEVRRKDEELIKANEFLTSAIERNTEAIEKSSGIRSIDAAKEARSQQEQKNANLLERWANDMGYHDSHHSNNYYWELEQSTVRDVNEALAKLGSGMAGKVRAYRWDDFLSLTPEEINYIRENYRKAWEDITTEGKYDWVYDALNEYADQAGKIAEIDERLANSLTLLTVDGLHDSFLSELMDMEKDVDDFGDDFTETLQKAIVNAQIGDMMDEELKAFRDDMARRMKDRGADGLSEADVDDLRRQWDAIVQTGIEIRDNAARITGFDGGAQSRSQSATSNSISGISYDQADALEGIMLGHTVQFEQGNATRDLILQNLQTMQLTFGGTFSELRNLTIQANGTRESMLKVMKERYESFDTKLSDIYRELKAQA